MATCEANELAEVAGPAVAGVLSLWDLLLLRVEAVRAEESYVVTLCDELQSLLEKVQTVASEILKPLDVKSESKEHQLEVNLLYCPEYYMFCEQRQNIDFGGGHVRLSFNLLSAPALQHMEKFRGMTCNSRGSFIFIFSSS